jgi:hypothetical protein
VTERGIRRLWWTRQFCEEFPDPITGEPINFNFLPIYADPRLLLWPHTVQMYSYGDPAYVAHASFSLSLSHTYTPTHSHSLTDLHVYAYYVDRRMARVTLTLCLNSCTSKLQLGSGLSVSTRRRLTGSTMITRHADRQAQTERDGSERECVCVSVSERPETAYWVNYDNQARPTDRQA